MLIKSSLFDYSIYDISFLIYPALCCYWLCAYALAILYSNMIPPVIVHSILLGVLWLQPRVLTQWWANIYKSFACSVSGYVFHILIGILIATRIKAVMDNWKWQTEHKASNTDWTNLVPWFASTSVGLLVGDIFST